MKQLISLILLCNASAFLFAQTNAKCKPLTIGQRVPEVYVKGIHNYAKQTESLTAFYKDKPLIIAFWDTHCNTCLRSFPKLDSLAKLNGNSFNVLSVCRQKNTDIVQLFNSVKMLKNIKLPYIAEDTILNRMFKHVFLPHVVWINTKGIVVAITTEDEVNNSNVQEFVRNNDIHLFEKDDDFTFDIHNPYEPPASSVLYRSVFAQYNPRIAGSELLNCKRDSAGNISDSVTRAFFANYDALQLLFIAFAALCDINNFGRPLEKRIVNNSTVIRFNDAAGDSLRKEIQWKFEHLYCYDLITQPENKLNFFGSMLNDLNRYLPVTATIEERVMPCYDIVRISPPDSNDAQITEMQPSYQSYLDTTSHETVYKIQNLPLDVIISDLNTYSKNEPLFNETNAKQPLNAEIRLRIKEKNAQVEYDIKNLKEELNRNGLDLVENRRLMKVLVITDKE